MFSFRLTGYVVAASLLPLLTLAAEEEYRGKFTPDAEYVLSGKLAADLPPLPDVPFSLEAPGFRDDFLSEVPPVGVHPRVVLSPRDIDEIKANIAKGKNADVTFRVCHRELRNKAANPKPMRDTFGNAPWGGIGVIAAKGLLALLTDDQDLGREAAEWTVKHAQYLEPRIEILNTHPAAQAFKDNFYYFSRAGVRVGGLDYTTAYREGGADRVRELAAERVEFFGEDNQWAYTSLGAEYEYCAPIMTEPQRDYVRSVISRATSGKYTTGMEIPGHFFINNHMSMGAEFYTLLLSIEGEKGFDVRAAEQCIPRLMDKLTYDISPDGILYENVSYECRSDVFYGGHETPEQGDFRFSADGVLWSPYTGAYMDAYFRNMVLVDGYAGVYQPTPGKLLEVANTDDAATIVSDATEAYRWKKQEKNFYHWHGMLNEAPLFTDWLRNRGWRMNRDWELPFQPHMKEFYDGFAHLDWGPWHGETRGPEYYERWNDMEYVYRTLHLARGTHPYVLIVDDLKKDDSPHQYDWNFALPGDVRLYNADSAAKNRHLEKGTDDAIGTDLILCLGDAAQKRSTTQTFGGGLPNIEYEPQEGDPMLLVRVLWRNTSFPYPLPSFEQAWQFNRIQVPAYAVEPEFKVLLYPYRFGEPLPFTRWSDDRSELLVSFDAQEDTYTFQRGTGGRTVFAMHRNGRPVITATSRPAPPRIKNMGGHTPDRNLPESQQQERTLLFADRLDVTLADPAPGCEIRYTLDGSAPNDGSALYTGPIRLREDCVLKAVTAHHGWVFGKNTSEPLAVACRQIPASPPIQPDGKQRAGLACEVFSIHHTIFEEDSGVFTGHKNMLPELAETDRLAQVAVDGFTIPPIGPKVPKTEMHKGYYRYRGLLHAPANGVYRFRVFSCGPVRMTVAGQHVLDVTGPYGLSQKYRYVGFFRAVQAGDYAFRIDPSGANRLTIGNQVVACANIQGCEPVDLLDLEPGLYSLEFVNLFGSAELRVRSPGTDEFRPAVPGQLARAAEQEMLPDTRGPVAVIDFESITNNVVAVQSERSLTARLSGAEAVATPFGQGVAFTGENPYLELSGLQWPAPACTVSMWLKRGKSGDSLAFRGMPNKFQVRLRSRDAVWANYHRSPDAVHIQAGEKAANQEWFHRAVTLGEWVKVYVNGKLIGSRIVDPSAMYPGSSAYPASMLFMENETNGQLDEVRIFNRVLSENETRALAAP